MTRTTIFNKASLAVSTNTHVLNLQLQESDVQGLQQIYDFYGATKRARVKSRRLCLYGNRKAEIHVLPVANEFISNSFVFSFYSVHQHQIHQEITKLSPSPPIYARISILPSYAQLFQYILCNCCICIQSWCYIAEEMQQQHKLIRAMCLGGV